MKNPLPWHIAIIPDGNRRWAKKKNLKPWAGHREGVRRVKEIIEETGKLEIPCLSFWILSIDNIKNRPKREIDFLLALFNKYLNDLVRQKEIHEKEVKINILGFWKKFFPKELCQTIEKVIEATKNYNKYFLNLFVAYNGVDEIIESFKKVKEQAIKNPNLKITPDLVKRNLLTKDLPAVDYLIRTGGEPHLSAGFMMWDIANAQCYFTKTYFPDFGKKEFQKAIQEYQKRERRMGG